jgi:anti-anti-sigma factor
MPEVDPSSQSYIDRQISIRRKDIDGNGVVVLAVTGELDLLTTDTLTSKLREALAPPNKVVVLDMSEVQFLGSAGLSALVAGAESAKSGGIDFRLVASERVILRPLEITGIRSTFTVFDSVESALAARDA